MRYGNTVCFRWPLNQHIVTAGWWYNNGNYHKALDLRASVGTPVYAAEDGTVETAYHWNGVVTNGDTNSYGNMVKIRHTDYTNSKGAKLPLHTLYAHLDSICVNSGQTVKEGEIIGYSGNTGHSQAAHLHFEVRLNNVRYNPLSWLDGDFTAKDEDTKNHLGTFESVVRPAERFGYLLDISKHQGDISDAQWADISAKCDGVIIRLGYRGYGSGQIKLDEKFAQNISAAKKYGLPVGIYFFTQAVNATEGEEEADLVAQYVSPAELAYPVFIDTEMADGGNGRADCISNADRTAAVNAFCERAKHHGFVAGVYASTSWFASKLNDGELKEFDHWVADYRGYNGYSGETAIWQYSSKNAIGILDFGQKLDCNRVYKDYLSDTKTQQTTKHLYDVTGLKMSEGDKDTICSMLDKLGIKYNIVTT